MRSIMGMRKLRVLPVPVEAVARMSLPSSAGGMAPAWTGVGSHEAGGGEAVLQRVRDVEVGEADVVARRGGVIVTAMGAAAASVSQSDSRVAVVKSFP